jgi:small basic protein (TIGR04137 family)
MSIDKSLRRKNSLARTRNVLNRGERIGQLKNDEKWVDGRSPFGLPKTKVVKIVVKKAKKKEEKAAEGAEGAAAAAPAAAAPAAPAVKK